MMNLNGKDFVHVNGGVFPTLFYPEIYPILLGLFYGEYKQKQQKVRLRIDGMSD